MTTIRQVLGDAPNVCPHTETVDTPLGPLCTLCDTQLPQLTIAGALKLAVKLFVPEYDETERGSRPEAARSIRAALRRHEPALDVKTVSEPTKRSGPDIVQLPEGVDPLTDPVYRRIEAHNEREMRRYEASKAARDA